MFFCFIFDVYLPHCQLRVAYYDEFVLGYRDCELEPDYYLSSSLLEEGKSKRMACSIISPVGASSCSPSQALVCREVASTFRINQSDLSDFVSC